MPIYSNLYSNLARQGFAKQLTHGYAQSVVAATHPQNLYHQNRPGFGLNRRASKVGNAYHFQNAFHTSSQQSATAAVREGGRLERGEGGLDAYFDAWNKQHPVGEPEKEWTQFQFAKRIEWIPSSIQAEVAVEAPEAKDEVEVANSLSVEAPKLLERAFSASAVDERKVQFDAAEVAALAEIDAAIEKEIKSRNDQAALEIFEAELSVVAARVPTPVRVSSPAQSLHSSAEQQSPATSATSLSTEAERQSHSYAEHLTKLSESERYAEIPAVFEAMLVANIQPTAVAYNALLSAAIHLPAEKNQVVPKALDVYTDMMRRKVSPNTAIYSTLIDLLASRSLEVSSLKQSLEGKRVRYGGFEEEGKFMFASNEIEYAILAEDDRLDLAIRLFEASVSYHTSRSYTPEIYHQLIAACAEAGRVQEMIRFYEHMKASKTIPLSATFPALIKAHNQTGALNSAVDCYNEYKALAIAQDNGELTMRDREDAKVYASLISAYIYSGKVDGAVHFFTRIVNSGNNSTSLQDTLIHRGFVDGFLSRKMFPEAMEWVNKLSTGTMPLSWAKTAIVAADCGEKMIALQAFSMIPEDYADLSTPASAVLALTVREGDVQAAQYYWNILENSPATKDFIEPTAMFAVALIGSGNLESVAAGLNMFDQMLARIKAAAGSTDVTDELEESIDFIIRFMGARNIIDPRTNLPQPTIAYQHDHLGDQATPIFQQFIPSIPYQPAPEDNFDPYAASTDFKGSSLIGDLVERIHGGRGRLDEALAKFKNIRRAGRHPRYITYAKLIAAAAREERTNLVHEILAMARSDVPLLVQYPLVRYGWASILDAMVAACLTLGDRPMADQYHQELLDMGSAPTANTFGLYITTMKESTKTFDEATEAVKIFHRAKSENVELTSFLYNALIGKLGKARRIDDCLFYFAEMRALGIKPTSVTYGTIVNALCRVSDEKFAVELFEEMESMPNYKARAAPYNSLMQFYQSTKRDKAKVLAFYERMKSKGIQPTNHTFKLLVDTHATLEPINLGAAEAVLDLMRSTGQKPEPVHYAALIHAKGCVLHDMDGARAVFDSVMADRSIRPQACLYQSLFEAMVANHVVADTEPLLRTMAAYRVEMTPYIANTLIKGWASELNIEKSKAVFASLGRDKKEPSTYDAMTRAYLAVEDKAGAGRVVQEMLSRGYPGAVSNKISDLLAGGNTEHTI